MESKKKVFILTLLFLFILITIMFILGKETLLMPGELHEAHEILSPDCENCHTPFQNHFEKCNKCHTDITDISLHSISTIKCAFCHSAHLGKEKQIDIKSCILKACHKKMSGKPDHSGDQKICLKCHPEHQFEKTGLNKIKTSDLIFSHKTHSDKRNIKAYYPCVSCHQILDEKNKMTFPKALDQCKKCHPRKTDKHDTDKKITEEGCPWCHYPEKKKLNRLNRLKHARFNHSSHFNFECIQCHFRINKFNKLQDIHIFSGKDKFSFCTVCHIKANEKISSNIVVTGLKIL